MVQVVALLDELDALAKGIGLVLLNPDEKKRTRKVPRKHLGFQATLKTHAANVEKEKRAKNFWGVEGQIQ